MEEIAPAGCCFCSGMIRLHLLRHGLIHQNGLALACGAHKVITAVTYGRYCAQNGLALATVLMR